MFERASPEAGYFQQSHQLRVENSELTMGNLMVALMDIPKYLAMQYILRENLTGSRQESLMELMMDGLKSLEPEKEVLMG